jgi:hypothetical protein
MRLPIGKKVRPGIATLEFVMVFPLLLLLVAGLFLIAQADVFKVATVTAARQQAWQQRPQAPDGGPLQLLPNPSDSARSATPQNSFAMGPPFRGQTAQATSSNMLIANPWSSKAIPFASLAQNLSPHTDVMKLIDHGATEWIYFILTFLFDPHTNPAMVVLNFIGPIVNTILQIFGFILDDIFGAPFRAISSALQWFMNNVVDNVPFGAGCDIFPCDAINGAIQFLNFATSCWHNLNEASHGRKGDSTPVLGWFFGI